MTLISPDLEAVARVGSEPWGFWLDSSLPDARQGRHSFAGRRPSFVMRCWGRRVELSSPGGSRTCLDADPFEVLRGLLNERAGRDGMVAGYFGFGLARHIEDLPSMAAEDLGLPDCSLGFYEDVAVFDPGVFAPGVGASIRHPPFDALASSFSRAGYRRAVARCLDYIRAGDIYQVNLSQRFEADCPRPPIEVYRALRRLSPAPYGAIFTFPDFTLLSSSPERFLHYDPVSRVVETRPIKGTRPRGRDAQEDLALARDLMASGKDRAENLMIVDLERNDLGRVAEVGSVEVPELFGLESYASVHHLVSTVRCRLRPDCDAIDLLRATFPSGSVTGAPKLRAMQIIDELEPVARGPYTGAMGYIGFDGRVDLNVAIRIMVIKEGRAYFHVGGGIVADSDPEAEYQETLDKGAALARVLAAD
ncbi:MAG TPA: aminodeoxychorismate synthase component I [Dehalococcoidia bacterium]|nr:aminodeoxychorismate synthase component I [Dehalococcoidia bacterium]